MNTLVLQIAILFLPGIIWERIHATYVLKDKPEQFDIIRRAFVFGMLSYLLLFCGYGAFHQRFYLVALESDHIAFSFKIAREILYATLVAFFASLAHVAFDSWKVFSFVIRKLKLTKRYGTEDVWDYVFSSRDHRLGYVNVRDFDKQIIYTGYVEIFSESEKLRELVLTSAIVYAFDGTELFKSPVVYIARDKDNIDIDFPEIPAAPLPTISQESPSNSGS